jgi:hypothetical protein
MGTALRRRSGGTQSARIARGFGKVQAHSRGTNWRLGSGVATTAVWYEGRFEGRFLGHTPTFDRRDTLSKAAQPGADDLTECWSRGKGHARCPLTRRQVHQT